VLRGNRPLGVLTDGLIDGSLRNGVLRLESSGSVAAIVAELGIVDLTEFAIDTPPDLGPLIRDLLRSHTSLEATKRGIAVQARV